MSFKITITETREVTKIAQPEWRVVDNVEVARDNLLLDGNETSKTRIKDVMGYTPEVTKTVVESQDIFEQTVDALDLAAVIKAVNGMGKKSRRAKK